MRYSVIGIFALSLSACATVDFVDVASQNQPVNASNVVERATQRLYTTFTQKGWSEDNARERVQSSARILLKGLNANTSEKGNITSAYVNIVTDVDVISSDIQSAISLINQTTQAAEIFLAVGNPDETFRDELRDLERALLASRRSERVFLGALNQIDPQKTHTESWAQLADLKQAYTALQSVTDTFGHRVRHSDMGVGAAS